MPKTSRKAGPKAGPRWAEGKAEGEAEGRAEGGETRGKVEGGETRGEAEGGAEVNLKAGSRVGAGYLCVRRRSPRVPQARGRGLRGLRATGLGLKVTGAR